MDKTEIAEFMSKHELCVISTVNDASTPESAIVGFSHDDTLSLFIGTSRKSRKFANLQRVPNVAIVIGGEDAEVQYEGVAEIIEPGMYKDLVVQRHISKLPGSAEYRDDPNQVYIKVTPSWIRLLQHGDSASMQEFTDFSWRT